MTDTKNAVAEQTRLTYLRKRRRQVRFYYTLLFAAALCIAGAVGVLFYKNTQINNRYAVLVGTTDSTPYQERVDRFKEAIRLCPQRPAAYIRLLEAYESEGNFDLAQSAEFTALYNGAKNLGQEKGSGELTYLAGRMYFVLYTENGEAAGMSTRVTKAASYFQACTQNPPDDQNKAMLASCYHLICRYYKDFIFSSAETKELTQADIQEILQAADNVLNSLSGATDHDKLMFAAALCNFIFDQRQQLAKAAPDKSQSILSILDRAYELAESTNVSRPDSVYVKTQTLENKEKYRAAIVFALGGEE